MLNGAQVPTLRHHRGRHPIAVAPERIGGDRAVLNAFRHHRGRHRSTVDAVPNATSAQRLSASQRSAPRPITAPPIPASNRCSTPFGITEAGTTDDSPHAAPAVLNAFRHHRGRHLSDAIDRLDLRALNAFRHHRAPSRHPITDQAHSSAQRLSASQRSAREVGDRREPQSSCAQRLSASQRSAHRGKRPLLSMSWCSTPFGITEVGTPLPGPTRSSAQRLSASQRSAHLQE